MQALADRGRRRVRGARRVGLLAASLVLALLSGCGLKQVANGFDGLPPDADPARFTCCYNPERYPAPFVTVSLAVAPAFLDLNPFDQNNLRPGLISGNEAAYRHITSVARPLDLVFLANKSYIGGRYVPGRFTHSAIYLGSEAELREIGMWNDPAIVPLHEKIRAGGRFIEAVHPVVRLATPEQLLQVDSVAILRPELSLAQRREAARIGVGALGAPFDYWFDDRTKGDYSCTELISAAMPSLKLPEIVAYGRPAVMPDAVVTQAIRGERLKLLEHVRGVKGGGYAVEGVRPVMEDIAAFWGPDPNAN